MPSAGRVRRCPGGGGHPRSWTPRRAEDDRSFSEDTFRAAADLPSHPPTLPALSAAPGEAAGPVLPCRLGMPARKRPTPQDAATARRLLLNGMARDTGVSELAGELAPLDPRGNTFPGEVLLQVAADALEWCGASRADPLALEGMPERFLPECAFRGRENKKLQFTVLAAALRGGAEPTCSVRSPGGKPTPPPGRLAMPCSCSAELRRARCLSPRPDAPRRSGGASATHGRTAPTARRETPRRHTRTHEPARCRTHSQAARLTKRGSRL